MRGVQVKRLFLMFLFPVLIYGQEGRVLCQKLNLQPGTKASIQWERIFKSEARQKRLGIDKLTEREKKVLEVYLLEHAADSAHPMVPGL